jgi:hypothetical protein
MSCPTCGHTLEFVIRHVHWCPRCGTLVSCGVEELAEAPKLVERCRAFEAYLHRPGPGGGKPMDRHRWRQLGVAESIHPPAGRPAHEKAPGGDSPPGA